MGEDENVEESGSEEGDGEKEEDIESQDCNQSSLIMQDLEVFGQSACDRPGVYVTQNMDVCSDDGQTTGITMKEVKLHNKHGKYGIR